MEQKQEQKELNKDFTTMVKAIELAQEAGGSYYLQVAAAALMAMNNLGRFIQNANELMEREQQSESAEKMDATPVEKGPKTPAAKVAKKKTSV
jgi:predicted HTH transcriptional regulator